MADNVILRYNVILCIMTFLLLGCMPSQQSKIPDGQAKIIRNILRVNGYSIGDNELVDNYIEFGSTSVDWNAQDMYWLVLPLTGQKQLVLTEDINKLNDMFQGITTHWDSERTIKKPVDTIIVIGDTNINVKILSAHDDSLRTLPIGIKLLRATIFNFNNNQISHLPTEIMQLTLKPILYDTVTLYLDYNKLDTCSVNDSLKTWLNTHAGQYWWQLQNPDSCHP